MDLGPARPGPVWLDGEVVALDESGLSKSSLLQETFDQRRSSNLVIFFFDMPFADGWDLRAVPLAERQALLADRLGDDSEQVRPWRGR